MTLKRKRCFPRAGAWLSALLALTAGVASAQVYSDIHDFDGYNAAGGAGQLQSGRAVFDKAGNMYGISPSGGAYNNGGTVWEIAAGGGYRVLHNFGASGAGDGSSPTGIALDSNGNLWGSTFWGGSDNFSGAIYEIINPSGANPGYNLAYSLVNAGLMWPLGAVTVDTAGNVYGTCSGGGSTRGGVWRFNPSSGLTVLHGFATVSPDGYYAMGNVALDSNGNLFGTCFQATNGTGTIWEVAGAAGSSPSYSTVHTFTGADGSDPTYAIPVFDSAGNMYGVTENGGAYGSGEIWEVTPSGGFSVLYSFKNNAHAQGGICFDPAGNMFGTCQGYSAAGVLWEYSATGTFSVVHTFSGTLPSGGPDGAGPNSDLTYYNGVVYGTTPSGGINGAGILFGLSYAPTISLTTARDPNPAIAGGVGVSFAATVSISSSFAGGKVTLTSADGGHLLVNGAASKCFTLPAGAVSQAFTITAPADVAAATPVVLTASAAGCTPTTTAITVKPFVKSIMGLSAGVKSGGVQSAAVCVYEVPATAQMIAISTSTPGNVFSRMNIYVPAGGAGGKPQSNPFSVHCVFVDADAPASMTATHASLSAASSNFTIFGPKLIMLALSPSNSGDPTSSAITLGQPITIYAVLDSPRETSTTLQIGINSGSIAGVEPPVTVAIAAGQEVSTGKKFTPLEPGTLTCVPLGSPYGVSSATATIVTSLPAVSSTTVGLNVPAAPANAVGGDFFNASVSLPGVPGEQLTCVLSTDNPAVLPSTSVSPAAGASGTLIFRAKVTSAVTQNATTCNLFYQFADARGNLIGSPALLSPISIVPLLKSLTPANGATLTYEGGKSETAGSIQLWESYPSAYTPSPAPISTNVTITSSDPSVYFAVPGSPYSTVETLSIAKKTSVPIVFDTLFRLWFMGNASSTVSIFRPAGMPTSTFTVITTP